MKIEKSKLLCISMMFLSSVVFAADEQSILENYVENTVVVTYSNMSSAALDFASAAKKLKSNPNDANLKAAAEQWSKTRKFWEQSEAFLYGPAAFASLDPHLDSWPLDKSQLDTFIDSLNSGKVNVDAAYVRGGLGAAFRGFHAAEYIMFRDGKVRLAKDISKGELAYLSAVADVIAEDCIALEAWWRGSENMDKKKISILEEAEIETSGSYANEMKNAGKTGSRYESSKEAIEEIFDGCIDIVDELVESKLGTPAKTGNPMECESYCSGTSIIDVRNNIISVRNSYEGIGSDGKNISALVSLKSKEADQSVKNSIEKALKDIDSLKAPLFKNLAENKDSLKTAIASCKELSESLGKAKEIAVD